MESGFCRWFNNGYPLFHNPHNLLASIPTDNLKQVETLLCSNNHLGELYVNEIAALKTLDCSYNHLTELAMNRLTNLVSVNCSNNQFEQNRLMFPESGSALKVVIADNCISNESGPLRLNLSSHPIEILKMSNNPGLKWVDVNRQNIKTYAVRNCGLIGEHALHYFDVDASWSVADTIDVSGNPNLKPKMSYYKGSCPNLIYVDLTGCNIQNDIVFYGDDLRQDLQ